MTEVTRAVVTFPAWVPKKSSHASNLDFPEFDCADNKWEIGVNSVGNGGAEVWSRPWIKRFCRWPTNHRHLSASCLLMPLAVVGRQRSVSSFTRVAGAMRIQASASRSFTSANLARLRSTTTHAGRLPQ